MRILKSFFIAFSIYSRIPVPQFQWKDEDMRYMLCFFPWVGAVIGALLYLWACICLWLGVGEICYVLLGTAIPILVTGGFHVDGFMDTMDAFHSWQPRERKLEILKDSHIGAFSVIMLVWYGLLYMAAFSEVRNLELLKIFGAGFFLSRGLSGIGVVTMKGAKKDGLLHTFASSSEKIIVRCALVVQCVLCVGVMMWLDLVAGALAAVAAALVFLYYGYRCNKELGGITGDTAGYFVLICEEVMLVVIAIINILR